MATFSWDITEGIPVVLESSVGGAGGVYTVRLEDFDIALGRLPFLLYANEGNPYERVTAQWQKDQFDTATNVGEQSLTGWWLRSQDRFFGGDGITYFDPLLGNGSETRFRDSRRVDVFSSNAGEVTLLHDTDEEATFGASDVEAIAGPNRVLLRDGGNVSVWDGSTESSVSGTTTANSLAYTGSEFLVGDDTDIYSLGESSGTTLSSVWNSAASAVKVFWAKQRIFATIGPEIYELTLSGGDLSTESPLYTHPDDDWEWTSITETGGAVWAAGFSGGRCAVHVIVIDEEGATVSLTGATVGIQLPEGEIVNQILGYLDFLLIGTDRGFRAAVVDGATAVLGPLVFRDEEVHSVAARGDFAWCGLSSGLTRRVDLGNEVGGDLLFAWAHDIEGTGDILALTFYGEQLCLAGASNGFYVESADDLTESGYLTTGFTRFGTLENKYFRNVYVTANAPDGSGSIAVAGGPQDPPRDLVTLANFDGSQNVSLHIPGAVAQRVSLTFTLNRDDGDSTAGPTLQSYQLRGMPAPDKKQRLIQLPLMCFDDERDRWGTPLGGPKFAWTRLQELERFERDGQPVVVQDFRTGEARNAIIEQVHFAGLYSPDRSEPNFGGTVNVTARTVD